MDQKTQVAIQWIEQEMKVSCLACSELKGGQSTLLHELSMKNNQGTIQEIVLREYNNEEWLEEEPYIPGQEAKNLKLIEELEVSTPRLLLLDDSGEVNGRPLVVMSKIEGKIKSLKNGDNDYLKQLAEALVLIHQLSFPKDFQEYFSYYNSESIESPQWSELSDEWKQLSKELSKDKTTSIEKVFIHRDYHPLNVLWTDDKLAGIVDWPSACKGPREIDLGHCRWNLWMMYGKDAAERFLQEYQELANYQYDYYWDLVALGNVYSLDTPTPHAGWVYLGLEDLTSELLSKRMDQMLSHALNRITL